MTDIISSDHPLPIEQQRILEALLDTLVPASEDGRMPSAAELDLIGWLALNASDYLSALPGLLDKFEAGFAELSLDERIARTDDFNKAEPDAFNMLLFQVYCCYYEDDRVLTAIGAGAGPPFPRGNEVESGDLSLLDQVNRLGKQYRRVDIDEPR